jgi:hypothetical protein
MVIRDFSHGGKLESLAPERKPAREDRNKQNHVRMVSQFTDSTAPQIWAVT